MHLRRGSDVDRTVARLAGWFGAAFDANSREPQLELTAPARMFSLPVVKIDVCPTTPNRV
jgi:hypothetical protein